MDDDGFGEGCASLILLIVLLFGLIFTLNQLGNWSKNELIKINGGNFNYWSVSNGSLFPSEYKEYEYNCEIKEKKDNVFLVHCQNLKNENSVDVFATKFEYVVHPDTIKK